MRIAYAIISPLLLLGGCATTGEGPHTHGAQTMQDCPMMSAHGAEQTQSAMMGGHSRRMMEHGQMSPGMADANMPNCPMAEEAAQPPSAPPPADPHQH